MTSPAQSKFQEYTYSEYIKRIKELASEASTDIRDIEDNHEGNTNLSKVIQESKTSLQTILRRTSSIYESLHTSSPGEASKKCKEATKTTPTQSPESDQNRDTEGDNTQDKINNSNDAIEPTTAMESPQYIQQEVREDLGQSHLSQGKPNTADSGDDRELQGTPRIQQCTSAPTEEDKTINSDVPRENLDLPEDHTQPKTKDPTGSSLGEETSREPPRSQRTTTGKPSTRLNLDTASDTIRELQDTPGTQHSTVTPTGVGEGHCLLD